MVTISFADTWPESVLSLASFCNGVVITPFGKADSWIRVYYIQSQIVLLSVYDF